MACQVGTTLAEATAAIIANDIDADKARECDVHGGRVANKLKKMELRAEKLSSLHLEYFDPSMGTWQRIRNESDWQVLGLHFYFPRVLEYPVNAHMQSLRCALEDEA